ncbi:MAG: sigma-70 family RNA polymerase sigma factor [Candidatus Omnitrophica bacterium]|nr:sigma-70 family RNA polymerase sigma factor [Candidatus Omnitrophota bacterium]
MPFPDNTNPYLSDPDVRLMLDFQGGDKASFEALMRKYYPRLLNFIYRFTGSAELAEDLTQEVFLKVYSASTAYRPKSKFQTWVYTIAKNISLNELRRHKKTPLSLDEPFLSEDGPVQRQLEDTQTPRADEQMLRDETSAAVRAAINSLPENQRVAVILRRYEQFSYEEIGQTMQMSVKAVKSLLSRGKENLKNKLTPAGTFE